MSYFVFALKEGTELTKSNCFSFQNSLFLLRLFLILLHNMF